MTRAEREALRLRIDRVKRARLEQARRCATFYNHEDRVKYARARDREGRLL